MKLEKAKVSSGTLSGHYCYYSPAKQVRTRVHIKGTRVLSLFVMKISQGSQRIPILLISGKLDKIGELVVSDDDNKIPTNVRILSG